MYKKHTIWILLLVTLPVTVVGGINYIVDPLQIYRPSRDAFHVNQRERYAGWIRSYLSDQYDSIIVGTSLSGNFLPSDVARMMGWKKTMKLNMGGGRPIEQLFILEQALRHKNVKHVLWEIRTTSLFEGVLSSWHPKREFNKFLYTRTILDDGKYLFSIDNAKASLALLGNKLPKYYNDEYGFEDAGYWMRKNVRAVARFNLPKSLGKFAHKESDAGLKELRKEDCNRKINYELIHDMIISFIKKHPDVEFRLFFPPRLRFTWSYNLEKFDCTFSAVRYLVDNLDSLPNVKMYGFDDQDGLVGNFANYKDGGHYHSGVNLWMLDRMKNGKNRLSKENIEKYIEAYRDAVLQSSVLSDMETMIPLRKEEETIKLKRYVEKLSSRKAKLKAKRLKTASKKKIGES